MPFFTEDVRSPNSRDKFRGADHETVRPSARSGREAPSEAAVRPRLNQSLDRAFPRNLGPLGSFRAVRRYANVESVADTYDELWNWEERPLEERQLQTEAVSAAEFFTRQLGPEVGEVEADQAGSFLSQTLSTSGFERPSPVVVVDLDDADTVAQLLEPGAAELLEQGWHMHGLVKDDVIHLHPQRLDKWTLLHELAHYIAPHASHGPIWCRIYLQLASECLGGEASETLHSNLLEQSARVADSTE